VQVCLKGSDQSISEPTHSALSEGEKAGAGLKRREGGQMFHEFRLKIVIEESGIMFESR
jgi:hypothetical protein